MRNYTFLTVILILAPFRAAVTQAQFTIVEPEMCTVTTRAQEPVSILVCPDLDGTPLYQARRFGGGSVDATIEVVLRDANGDPVQYVSDLDLWLAAPGLVFCNGANTADLATGPDGWTCFSLARRASGTMSEPGLRVYYNGVPLGEGPVPHLRANSPDFTGDGHVNLSDVGAFAAAYYEGSYAADFFWDGFLNVADVGIMARHLGHFCP